MDISQRSAYVPKAPSFYTGLGEIEATYANLPHWNKANTACFVTFRLADSLPAEKLQALEVERADWLGRHPKPWDEETTREYHARFSAREQDWLDRGYGCCLLAKAEVREIVEASLWHFAGERYELYAHCVMPNHVHVMFMPRGEATASDVVQGWKSFTAHQIVRMGLHEGTLWQKESFDTLVRSERHFKAILKYIRENDLRRSWAYNMI